MRNIYKFTLLIAVLLALGTVLFAQSDEDTGECSPYIQETLKSIELYCDGISGNQACYGKNDITVETQDNADDFAFYQPGDIAELRYIKSMQLAEMNEAEDIWGMSLLRVITNAPVTGRASEVSLVLFGGVNIDNTATEPSVTLDGTVALNGLNMRGTPTTDGVIIVSGGLPLGTELRLIGRLEDMSWMRVKIVETKQVGWVATRFVNTEGDVSTLDVIEPDAAYYSSMQAFTYSSSTNTLGCSDMPTNGLLMQTPEGVAEVTISMNGVSINLHGTAFAQAEEDGETVISVLEGGGTVTSSTGEVVPLIPGTQVIVVNDLLDIEPMDESFENLADTLIGDIEVVDSVDETEITTLLDDYWGTGETTTTTTETTTTTTGDTPPAKDPCPGKSCEAPGQNK